MTCRVGTVGFDSKIEGALCDALSKRLKLEKAFSVLASADNGAINRSGAPTLISLEKFRSAELSHGSGLDSNLYSKVCDDIESDKHRIFGMMIRQGGEPNAYNYLEMQSLFEKLVESIISLLHESKPSIVIFRCIPHFAADYLLYKIANIFNIKCLTIETVEAFNSVYLIDDIDTKATTVQEKAKLSEFNEQVLKVLDEAENLKSFRPDYYVDVSSQRDFNNSRLGVIYWTLVELSKAILATLTGMRQKRAIKYYGTPNKSSVHYFEIFWEKLRARVNLKKIQKCHANLATEIIPEEFYLFVANYQPERTTLPDAGLYWNTLSVVREISRKLPAGITLLYREHPTVFNLPGSTYYRGWLYRSEEFYREIFNLPNVKIVSGEIDISSLVAASKGVISLTGTVAYQANISGKEAYLFGSRWFSQCSSMSSQVGGTSLTDFFAQVSEDPRENREQWLSFLSELGPYLFPVPDLLSRKGFDETAEPYIEALVKYVEAYAPGST